MRSKGISPCTLRLLNEESALVHVKKKKKKEWGKKERKIWITFTRRAGYADKKKDQESESRTWHT